MGQLSKGHHPWSKNRKDSMASLWPKGEKRRLVRQLEQDTRHAFNEANPELTPWLLAKAKRAAKRVHLQPKARRA